MRELQCSLFQENFNDYFITTLDMVKYLVRQNHIGGISWQ
jgi:hypothetical protein